MIIPVILEKTFKEIENKIHIAEKFAELIQIDFVDNTLFKGKTFLNARKLAEIETTANLEIHLLVSNPLDYLQEKLPRVIKICTQIEALNNANEFIDMAKGFGYKVGLSIGPDTNYDQLENYLDKLDYVQFMDIIPGVQGNSQIPEVLIKIKNFHQKYPNVPIQVDGGIRSKNIKQLKEIGVDDFVVGSELFTSSNPEQKYVELTDMIRDKISSLKDKKICKIAVLGGAAWTEEDETYKDAYTVCKVLAEAGYEIVNGGGPGVMRAATNGGHAGGGQVLAITYHPNKPKRHYEGVDTLNKFDDEIITLDYFDRTKVMLQTTQLHIVFKGSLGTLSEFGMSWISSWIHEPNNKPIILYGDFWKEFLHLMDKYLLVTDAERAIVNVCNSPEEVLEIVRKYDC